MSRFDVVALGELLIDFTNNADSEQGNPMFEANPGGAPCNVLSMLGNLGNKTAFIGKVGDDFFGRMLKERVEKQGIDTTGLFMDSDVHTTLAFVNKLPNGDRDFSFYRKPGADMMLTAAEVEQVKDVVLRQPQRHGDCLEHRQHQYGHGVFLHGRFPPQVKVVSGPRKPARARPPGGCPPHQARPAYRGRPPISASRPRLTGFPPRDPSRRPGGIPYYHSTKTQTVKPCRPNVYAQLFA